jgi:hypothetical protein
MDSEMGKDIKRVTDDVSIEVKTEQGSAQKLLK